MMLLAVGVSLLAPAIGKTKDAPRTHQVQPFSTRLARVDDISFLFFEFPGEPGLLESQYYLSTVCLLATISVSSARVLGCSYSPSLGKVGSHCDLILVVHFASNMRLSVL
jgi:hypothetical protein